MVISSDSSVERSKKVIDPGQYASSKGGIARSSESRGENLWVVVAAFLVPEPGPQMVLPLLAQVWVEGQMK